MPRFRPANVDDPGYWDANQVVAYNFREIRRKYGWTQEFTANRLGTHLDQTVKKSTISAIERTVDSDRRRIFNAQELVAFSQTFNVAVIYFLMPPPIEGLSLAGTKASLINLWTLVIGEDDQQELIAERVKALYKADERETRSATQRIIGMGKLVTFEHFEARRFDAGMGMLIEKTNELDEVFDKMRATVAEYDRRSSRFRSHRDTDRQASSRVGKMLLGEKVLAAVGENRAPDDENWKELKALFDHDDVPWENIVDTDDPAIKQALDALFAAIEPHAFDYQMHKHKEKDADVQNQADDGSTRQGSDG